MDASDISDIFVVGAGTMGAGIAGTFARSGCNVHLADVGEDVLQQGLERLDEAQRVLASTGTISSEEVVSARARVQATTDLDGACGRVDLVVEAVSEDLQLKRELFGRLDGLCPPQAVLATNTSGLPISQIAEATQRPAQVAGLHFWNPPHIVPLVEVTRGAATSEATAQLLMAVCRRLGKQPILVRHDVPGFVGNRLQFAVMREALHILSEGIASAEDIDTAMMAGPGLRYGLIGPLQTADLGGLDIFLAISRYLFRELNSSPEAPDALSRLVEEGKLGAKTGEGFYTYSKEDLSRIIERRDRVLLEFLDVLRREADKREVS